MAKISLVLVFSLVVALPWRWAVAQDDPWKSLADQAAAQGISQQSIDDAQAALRGATADSDQSVWADWIKGNANNLGYKDEKAPTSADGGSSSEEPDASDFADIGVDESSPAGATPTYSPYYAPESQAPEAETPEAQSPAAETPAADAPAAATPAAATPEAYSPEAPAPSAAAPSAATPDAETPNSAAPTSEAEAPDAVTPVAQTPSAASPDAETPGGAAPTSEAEAPDVATSPAQSPGASSPEAA